MAEYTLIEVDDTVQVEAPEGGFKYHNDKGWIHGKPSYALTSEKAGATVYFDTSRNGRVIVQGFGGDRAKEDFYESYTTFDKAKDKAFRYLNGQYSSKVWKASLKKERNAPANVEVGDIFVNSWGYEQTNVDFYQVVAKTASTVKLKQVGSESVEQCGWASDYCKPVKDAFVENGKEITKRVQNYGGEPSLSFEHGSGSKWNGGKKYRSWYA